MRKLPLLLNTLLTAATAWAVSTPTLAQSNNVYTYHYNNQRTGANMNETQLTPANVNQTQFGKIFSHHVDGAIYAQPLYVAAVSIPGKGTHNVLYVLTEHGSVYAWDADTGTGSSATPLWQISAADADDGRAPMSGEINPALPDVLPEVCITGTPVIDASTNVMYFVAQTYDTVNGVHSYNQRLHAVDIRTGGELAPFPVLIQATVPGTDRIPGNTQCIFNAQTALQRSALVLSGGVIYIGWCGITEQGRHGWIMSYNAIGYTGTPGAQVGAFCTTPNAGIGGVWGSGNGLADDDHGNLFTVTGNGTFDIFKPGGANYGQCVLRISTAAGLTVSDYFSPFNNFALNDIDGDLGSGGAILLPDSVGSAQHPHLLVTCGKEGRIYLLDRDNLGHYSATTDSVVQELPGAVGGVWGSPAFWSDGVHSYVYYDGANDVGETGDYMKQFAISNGQLTPTPVAQAPTLTQFPGITPSVSSNGATNGIVWGVQTEGFYTHIPAILHAYDATNIANELWNSTQAGGRDALGAPSKFVTPVVANGKVYVGTRTAITAFGLLPGPAPTVVTAAAATPASVSGTTASLSVLGGDTVAHGGEANLTYTWSATGAPPGAVSFSPNGTNAAKSSTVTFGALGTYKMQCTILGSTGLTVTSAVTVTVIQSAATTTVSPGTTTVFVNSTTPFTATGIDQFGTTIPSTAAWKWYLDPGSVGAVSKTGVYTAGTGSGSATVRAKFNGTGVGGTASVNVVISTAPPTIVNAAACASNPTTGLSGTLSCLGADVNGEVSLKYKWTVVGSQPGKVTYATNNNNTAKTTVVTFASPGVYNLACVITGLSGSTVTSPLTITVNAGP